MKIRLNGKEINTEAKSITNLLAEQGLEGKPVLVEYNQSALIASAHTSTIIKEKDQIEFFVLGAGG